MKETDGMSVTKGLCAEEDTTLKRLIRNTQDTCYAEKGILILRFCHQLTRCHGMLRILHRVSLKGSDSRAFL